MSTIIKEKKPIKSVTLHPLVIKAAEELANKEGRSFSSVVERCLEQCLMKN